MTEVTLSPLSTISTSDRHSRNLNNFDLIRLLAAGQVVIHHATTHLGLRLPFHEITAPILDAFPGVPIFFVISGFLITQSYVRSKSLSDYARNRFLRLFPALWLCFAVSVALIAASGYFAANPPPPRGFLAWAIAQLSFVQFYNPAFMRDWGVGVVNGSLWTIPVEMQFYILAPIFVVIFMRVRWLFIAAFFGFAIANAALPLIEGRSEVPEVLTKLIAVTFLPWFYMFMLGAVINLNWDSVRGLFERRFLWWFSAYFAVAVVDAMWNIGAHGNTIAFPWVLMIAGVVLSGAYTMPSLADRLLSRNDISYGLYIYHMPVFNFALVMWPDRPAFVGWIAIATASVFAGLSWRLVEKPALALKNSTLLRRERPSTEGEY